MEPLKRAFWWGLGMAIVFGFLHVVTLYERINFQLFIINKYADYLLPVTETPAKEYDDIEKKEIRDLITEVKEKI